MASDPAVAITGATGFIGRHLCQAFADSGWRVRALVRAGNTKPVAGVAEVVHAALEPAALARAADGCDVLVHAAGLARARRPSRLELVNVAGTRAAVDAANATGARLVYISSQAAIGPGTVERPARDDDPPRPVNAYGRSKAAAEAVVRSTARVPWVILRPTSVYGPGDRQFLPLFRMAARGIFIQAVAPGTPFTFLYIDDLVRAVVAASQSDRAAGQSMLLGHPDPLTAGGLLQLLARTFDKPYRPWRIPRPALGVAALAGEIAWLAGVEPVVDRSRLAELRAEGFVCAVDRTRDAIGFTAATPASEGIPRTAAWYRQEGWVGN